MWTQPRPQLSGNQDGDSVDRILGRPASFPDHAHDLHPAARAPVLLNFAPGELLWVRQLTRSVAIGRTADVV